MARAKYFKLLAAAVIASAVVYGWNFSRTYNIKIYDPNYCELAEAQTNDGWLLSCLDKDKI